MKQQLTWLREGGILRLFGDLDWESLNPLWDSRLDVMQDVILIDLSAIMHVDTAGIALLVHLVRGGKKQGAKVTLVGVSDSMLTLVQLYNLPEDILPY